MTNDLKHLLLQAWMSNSTVVSVVEYRGVNSTEVCLGKKQNSSQDLKILAGIGRPGKF